MEVDAQTGNAVVGKAICSISEQSYVGWRNRQFVFLPGKSMQHEDDWRVLDSIRQIENSDKPASSALDANLAFPRGKV
ncbi:hypothetical protein LP421_33595 (plasmid) [Rhizobium sp. RCAM05350]|nr:hypothetical protein LP421_33595 [Rhizobium sp. RCAM05350]